MWGPFAQLYGIKPWEFDQLTLKQFLTLEASARQAMESSDG